MTIQEQVEAKNAYMGIRHTSPWTIRYIRMALDCGVSAVQLKRLGKNLSAYQRDSLGKCIDFMVAEPDFGVCVNFDGDNRWQWKELAAGAKP